MNTKIIWTIVLLVITGISCRSQSSNTEERYTGSATLDSDKAKKINNEAMALVARNPFDKDSIERSIKLLDKAITLDSNSVQFLNNKLSLVCSLDGRYDEKISLLNKLIEKTDHVSYKLAKINLLSKTRNVDAASLYAETLRYYNEQSEKFPDSINVQIDRLFVKLLIDDTEIVRNEFEKIKDKNPDHPYVVNFSYSLDDFNREEFLNSLCQ